MDDKDIKRQVLLEEYNSVREETIKRVELSYQIINLNFIAAGALWAVGTTLADVVLFLYPWLALFLAAQYGANNFVIIELGVYTREAVEKDVYDLVWASYFEDRVRIGKWLNMISVFGIFAGTSAISLVMYWYVTARANPPRNALSEGFFWWGWVATIAIVIILCITALYGPIHVASKVEEKKRRKEVGK